MPGVQQNDAKSIFLLAKPWSVQLCRKYTSVCTEELQPWSLTLVFFSEDRATALLCISSKAPSSRVQLDKEREFLFSRTWSSRWNMKCTFGIFNIFSVREKAKHFHLKWNRAADCTSAGACKEWHSLSMPWDQGQDTDSSISQITNRQAPLACTSAIPGTSIPSCQRQTGRSTSVLSPAASRLLLGTTVLLLSFCYILWLLSYFRFLD